MGDRSMTTTDETTIVPRPGGYQLLPELPPDEYEALKADIAAHGVLVPIEVDEDGNILDGHTRERAWRELGKNEPPPLIVRQGLSEVEKRAHARKSNLLRRHLTSEQKRALVADQLRETPNWADRRVGRELGVDHKTVAAVRSGLASTGEFPQLDTGRVGADGRKRRRPARKLGEKELLDGELEDDDLDDRKRRRRDPWDGHPWNDPVGQAKIQHAVHLIEMGADPNGEKVAKLLRQASAFVIKSPPGSYNPFAGRSEEEHLEWHLFMIYLSFDPDAGRHGGEPLGVSAHVEWILQRPFQNVAEWLGDEGAKFRGSSSAVQISDDFKAGWSAFLDEHRDWSMERAVTHLQSLQRKFEEERAARRLSKVQREGTHANS
jgi:hypothetical protein